MKKIAVLIDFTEGSKVAFHQALSLSKKTGATLFGINIASSNDKFIQAENDLSAFITANSDAEDNVQSGIGVGNLFDAVPAIIKKIETDLVIVCTHGVKGMFQHLFGAHILKLVQAIPCPTIVMQENNKVNLSGIKSILFPMGPHPEFEVKIKQTVQFAKEASDHIIIYQIDRPGLDIGNQMEKNHQQVKAHFMEQDVSFSRVLDDLKIMSAGYSRQTLDYAVENNISMISIMATISKNDLLFGIGDKENFLINSTGIPILCCNQ